MTTIRQLIQTSPAKANELFAKLAETSGNAVKTRERLFSELKEELELQMRLEEQHLFPVLRKHKQTKDLVPDALNDNKQTRKSLTELEKTPKESEEFASKVAELRKAFQQHVRDERKELLPAVLKALDDEEAEAIVGKIEGAKAQVEEAKRAEAEERRSRRAPGRGARGAREGRERSTGRTREGRGCDAPTARAG
jgi:iron-sulfur cluster repair protein YtfE (RIC family)